MTLTPNVLECMHFSAQSSSEAKRKVINYEFDLYLDSERKIRLDGVNYNDTKGCLIFRKPGQTTSGIGNYNMYLLTLDFSDSTVDKQSMFRPATGKVQPLCEFDELNDIPPVFAPQHFEELKEILEKLSACSYPNAVDIERQKQYIKEFLLLVLYESTKIKRKNDIISTVNHHVKKACNYIAKNFRQNISIKDIASSINITENHLIKLFKKELKQTPNQYILELKLIHARYLILQSDHSIQEIAYSCGFNTPSYFTKRFFNRFNILPNDLKTKKHLL